MGRAAEAGGAPPGLDQVFDRVDEHREELIQRLVAYASQPSVSATGEGIAEAAELACRTLDAAGLEPSVLETGGSPAVVGTGPQRPGRLTVLVYGHYDVQPPDPLDAWRTPPFQPTLQDGRLYGRGTADNKGQHLAQILAMEGLRAANGELPCNVKVLLDGEEELGSPNLGPFVERHRDLLRADLAIWSDGPVHESGRWCLVFGVRGIVTFELRARGANRPLHSGNWGGVAPNPLWTLVHLLASMKDPHNRVTVEGFYDQVRPLEPLEAEALERMPVDLGRVLASLGLERLDEPADRGFYERLVAWPTLTINGLHGGYGGPGTQTILPNEAIAKCDVRLVPDQRTGDVLAKLRAHVARHAPGVELVAGGHMEPSRTPIDSPFTEPIRQAMRAALGEEPLLVPPLGGSLPAYVFTDILGVPTFGVPFANADQTNHAPNENLEVERFIGGIKAAASVLAHLGTMSAA
jgi:acetylornithine deacetylase/succinyl-diaminopimelate desuccinylase-like protein